MEMKDRGATALSLQLTRGFSAVTEYCQRLPNNQSKGALSTPALLQSQDQVFPSTSEPMTID